MGNSIIPSIWFDQNAKEAFDLYCQTVSNSRVTGNSPIVVETSGAGEALMKMKKNHYKRFNGINLSANGQALMLIMCIKKGDNDHPLFCIS
ncbi:VOC family protein [Sphingobacterium puteale]|uniref:VOC family protein n=1 Tax=Sphingobacterium puteale TaxID=2420510 RepID=UPI003D9749FA